MKTDARLVRQVLELGALERAELIEVLQASFGAPGAEGLDAAWGLEAESRIDAYETGALGIVDAADLLRKIAG